MRRLVLLVGSIVAVDTMFFAVLTPLLPHFAHRYGLSKSGAGLLVATYAAGALLAGVPAGLAASRFGPKRAVVGGLVLMGAASLGFALAGNVWMLASSRLLQGIGSALSWTGGLAWLVGGSPRERRGELLGSAMGAAVFGALLGPVLGAAAGVVGTRSAFVAVSLLAVALVVCALGTTGVDAEPQSLSDVGRAVSSPQLLAALWLISMPALLFGVLVVLVPLRLDRSGWGTIAIGAVFVVTTAFEVVINPLVGRFTDRRGRSLPIRVALLGSAAVSLALAWARSPVLVVPLVLAAGVVYGLFYTPALATISDRSEQLGLAQGLGFGLMNSGWAIGATVGPAFGGNVAHATSDAVPYLLLAGLCLATFAVSRPRPVAEPA